MTARRRRRPVVVGVVIGDPCGIGPEVLAKAWAEGRLHDRYRPVLIGSAHAMRDAAERAGTGLRVRTVETLDKFTGRRDVIEILDSGALDPGAITPGAEEAEHVALAVRRARAAGIDATGPVSPDTVFRRCIEGRYDTVLAMYHDQGHIAIKTARFAGKVAVVVGPPDPHVTVAQGTACDIVGRGIADHTMIRNAILTAGSLAAGRAFPTLQ